MEQLYQLYCCCCCLVASVVSDSVRPHRRQPTRLPHPWDSPGKNTGLGCHFLLQCRKVKSESEVAQSCPTRSDPMDCSPPGSSLHGIFQARVLEWGVIVFFSINYYHKAFHAKMGTIKDRKGKHLTEAEDKKHQKQKVERIHRKTIQKTP